jgi:hypothetical protein
VLAPCPVRRLATTANPTAARSAIGTMPGRAPSNTLSGLGATAFTTGGDHFGDGNQTPDGVFQIGPAVRARQSDFSPALQHPPLAKRWRPKPCPGEHDEEALARSGQAR